MKVSIDWLKELVDLNCSVGKLIDLLPLRSVSIKDVKDNSIELDMKGYNRADLLSLRGVAQEVAAITGSKVLFNEPSKAEFVWNEQSSSTSKQKLPNTKVTVSNPDFAPFYTITKIEGLKVEPSPKQWIERLASSGMRSVDNITDITNLIMLEYGQPMHAFDARAVKDEEIIVRTAKKGERITTLDGKTRDLSTSDLLIADPLNPLGIAGVMGGKDSEVSETTSTILLEAAIFDPVNIKKTVSALSLPSEASKRFQHGLTKKRLLQALNAAIKMYAELGGKVTAVTMAGNFEDAIRKITLTKKKLEDLVGVKFEDKQVEKYLQQLGFTLASQGQALSAWEVTVPYWRLDVNIEEDVIEEVARMYGYERIPAESVSQSKPLQKEDPLFERTSDLREKLVKAGLTEVQTYSFYSTQVLEALGLNDTQEKLVKIANPISSETQYLRQSIWANLVEVVGKNLRKGFKDIAVFEIGKAFSNIDGSPSESYNLSIALCNGSDNPLAELYEIAQKSSLHLEGVKLNKALFHPKRQIGNLAEVHLRVLNKMGIEKRVAILEISL